VNSRLFGLRKQHRHSPKKSKFIAFYRKKLNEARALKIEAQCQSLPERCDLGGERSLLGAIRTTVSRGNVRITSVIKLIDFGLSGAIENDNSFPLLFGVVTVWCLSSE
jgi:hypothetical protein